MEYTESAPMQTVLYVLFFVHISIRSGKAEKKENIPTFTDKFSLLDEAMRAVKTCTDLPLSFDKCIV